jgi:hypothetical protein
MNNECAAVQNNCGADGRRIHDGKIIYIPAMTESDNSKYSMLRALKMDDGNLCSICDFYNEAAVSACGECGMPLYVWDSSLMLMSHAVPVSSASLATPSSSGTLHRVTTAAAAAEASLNNSARGEEVLPSPAAAPASISTASAGGSGEEGGWLVATRGGRSGRCAAVRASGSLAVLIAPSVPAPLPLAQLTSSESAAPVIILAEVGTGGEGGTKVALHPRGDGFINALSSTTVIPGSKYPPGLAPTSLPNGGPVTVVPLNRGLYTLEERAAGIGGINRKSGIGPGWDCTSISCLRHNPSGQERCFGCGVLSGPKDSWECPTANCRFMNFTGRLRCKDCGQRRTQ